MLIQMSREGNTIARCFAADFAVLLVVSDVDFFFIFSIFVLLIIDVIRDIFRARLQPLLQDVVLRTDDLECD